MHITRVAVVPPVWIEPTSFLGDLGLRRAVRNRYRAFEHPVWRGEHGLGGWGFGMFFRAFLVNIDE